MIKTNKHFLKTDFRNARVEIEEEGKVVNVSNSLVVIKEEDVIPTIFSVEEGDVFIPEGSLVVKQPQITSLEILKKIVSNVPEGLYATAQCFTEEKEQEVITIIERTETVSLTFYCKNKKEKEIRLGYCDGQDAYVYFGGKVLHLKNTSIRFFNKGMCLVGTVEVCTKEILDFCVSLMKDKYKPDFFVGICELKEGEEV